MSPSSSSSLPSYKHQERIVVAPVLVGSSNVLQLDIGLETKWSEENDVTKTTATTTTPFPSSVSSILHRWGCLHIHIHVSTRTSQQYPESFLYDPSHSHTHSHSPAGVSITADMLLMEKEEEEEQNQQQNHHQQQQYSLVERRFQGLLRELQGERIVLAPIGSSSMKSPRLHRTILLHSTTTNTSTNTTNTNTTMNTVKMTTILPMEGAPAFSSEGWWSFASSRLVPTTCSSSSSSSNNSNSNINSGFGLWGSLMMRAPSNANTNTQSQSQSQRWSELLLGTATATTTTPNFGLTRNAKRGFWMDWTSTEECHLHFLMRRTSPCRCRYEASQGMYYSRQLAASTTTKEITDNHNDDNDNEHNDVHTTQILSLNSLIGETTTAMGTKFIPCPLADRTFIELQQNLQEPHNTNTHRHGHGHRHGHTSPKVEWIGGCRALASSSSSSLAHLVDPIDMNEPCIRITHNNNNHQESVATTTTTRDPFWKVHLNVLRPAGLANRGTLQTTLVNHHPSCAATVSYHHTIPNVIDPLWQSLRIETTLQQQTQQQKTWQSLQESSIHLQDQRYITISFQDVLPAKSNLLLSIDYEPAFLPYDWFPADANRGIEIPPAMVQFTFGSNGCGPSSSTTTTSSPVITLWTNALLILPPLPDMTMPFNVLSLTCTLYVYVIGSLIQLARRKVSAAVHKQSQRNPLKQTLRERIRNQWNILIVGNQRPQQQQQQTVT